MRPLALGLLRHRALQVREELQRARTQQRLVQMANDIGNFFRAEPKREDAIVGIANHIDRFWTQSMRRKLASHGESGLDELPKEALRRLANQGAPVPPLHEPPGGDAG